MDLQDPKIRPYLWGIFASEVSYTSNQGQTTIAQEKVEAGGADICPLCGQVIVNVTPIMGQKISIDQKLSPVVCDHTAALQVAETRLADLQSSQDRDWDVMTAWITRVKDMGVDFFNDPEVVAFRQVVLQTLWQGDEDRRVAVYDRIQEVPSDQLESANIEYQDILAHQQIITGLLAGDCIWFGA